MFHEMRSMYSRTCLKGLLTFTMENDHKSQVALQRRCEINVKSKYFSKRDDFKKWPNKPIGCPKE